MKNTYCQTLILLAAYFLVFSSGCSKRDAKLQPSLNETNIPSAVNQSFANAPGDTKAAMDGYVSALENHDTVTAFAKICQMSEQRNLTPEQRQVVAKSLVTTLLKMRAEAQNGDQAAQLALHQYLSTR
jgi:hypothetical protein